MSERDMSACTMNISPFDLYPKFYLDPAVNFRFPTLQDYVA